MATVPPTVQPTGAGLDESMSYAMSDIPGSPVRSPLGVPAADPLAYAQAAPPPSIATAPPPRAASMATMSPTREPSRLNKVIGMPGMQSYTGVAPIAQSIIAAAHAAGLSVSPGTPAGYHAPNFSTGSGGANFAYKPNLDANGNPTGTGTYINSFGQTMTY